MRRILSRSGFSLLVLGAACSTAPPPGPTPPPPDTSAVPPGMGALPPVPPVEGALAIDVVYPREGATINVRDSTFIFGNVGTGGAQLRINGAPVPTEPNGAFLAFLPVPRDGVYRLEASRAGQVVTAERHVQVPADAPLVSVGAVSIVEGSVAPRGALALVRGEPVTISVRGTPGALATLVLPSGVRVPMLEQSPAARSAYSTYRATIPAQPLLAEDSTIERPRVGTLEMETGTRAATGAATGGRRDSGLLGAPVSLSAAYVQLALAADTVRVPVALNLAVIDPSRPIVAVAADPVPVGGTNDGYVVGRPEPGGVSHYFWPNGTELVVTGERAGDLRIQLTGDLTAYAGASELQLLPDGTSRPSSLVSNVTISSDSGFIDIRFPLNRKLPFWVEEGENTLAVWLYGATSATDWLIYGRREPLIERAWWDQPRDDAYRLNISLTKPVWGYQTFWNERGQLILRIRKPPAIAAQSPLRGLLVTVDPGHGPPEGRWGPTRLTESQANLAIAFRLRDLIQAAGGRVQLTRTDSSAVGLYDRPAMSTRANADLFVSIHNNAVGDGVNPYTNHGTSTFFFHANSAALARLVQNELVNELGLPDLGFVRASLAVVRWPTWMPAILTEALFFMMPVQEAALRNPAVIDRIARAHLRGMEAFLRARAR